MRVFSSATGNFTLCGKLEVFQWTAHMCLKI
jgi:hypothetical protein